MRLREKVSKEEIAERVPRRPSRDMIAAKLPWRGRRAPEKPASRLSGVMETIRRRADQLANRSREQARRRRRKRFGIAAIGAAVAGFAAWMFSKAGRGAEPGYEPEGGAGTAETGTEESPEASAHESNGHRSEKETAPAS